MGKNGRRTHIETMLLLQTPLEQRLSSSTEHSVASVDYHNTQGQALDLSAAIESLVISRAGVPHAFLVAWES